MMLTDLRIGQIFAIGSDIYFKSGSHSVCKLFTRERYRVNPATPLHTAIVIAP